MKLSIYTLTIVLLLTFSNSSLISQPSKKEVKGYVEVYLLVDSTDTVRESMLQKLRKANPKLLQAPLKKALGEDETVDLALKLASTLRVPGLLKSVKKLVDGDYEDKAIKYISKCGDKGANSYLFDLWKAAEEESYRFEAVNGCLEGEFLHWDLISKLKAAISNSKLSETHRENALKFVRFQFGFSSDVKLEEINKKWKGLSSKYKVNGKFFAISGTAIDKRNGLELKNDCYKRNDNILIKDQAAIRFFLPAEWEKKNVIISFHIRVEQATAKVTPLEAGIACKDTEWFLFTERDKWRVKTDSGVDITHKIKLKEWHEVSFELYYEKFDDGSTKRLARIRIGGKEILARGILRGNLDEFWVLAKGGECTVGGLQYTIKD